MYYLILSYPFHFHSIAYSSSIYQLEDRHDVLQSECLPSFMAGSLERREKAPALMQANEQRRRVDGGGIQARAMLGSKKVDDKKRNANSMQFKEES